MAGFWKRFTNLFKVKANNALDKAEDNNRIGLLELKLTELKNGHSKSLNGLAKVKALHIKYEKDTEAFKEKSETYKSKASQLKDNYESAKKADKPQIKEDIILMLNKHENMLNEAAAKQADANNQEVIVENLKNKVKEMTTLIKTTESNITNMKARAEAAKVNKEISKELSTVNFDGISNQIEQMETKINEDNAEADAWGYIDTAVEDDEERINKILNESSTTENSKLFADFMEK